MKIFCAGEIESFKYAQPIGIGVVNSAINLTKSILFDRPDSILFIGSAGSYGDASMFDLLSSSIAANVEISYLDRHSYTPIDNVIDLKSKNVPRETIVNSSNYITTSKKHASKFLELGIRYENMEFYSVMSVAKRFEIPAYGLFVVTNYCFESAHEEFLKNHKEAISILDNYLKKSIKTSGEKLALS